MEGIRTYTELILAEEFLNGPLTEKDPSPLAQSHFLLDHYGQHLNKNLDTITNETNITVRCVWLNEGGQRRLGIAALGRGSIMIDGLFLGRRTVSLPLQEIFIRRDAGQFYHLVTLSKRRAVTYLGCLL